MRHVILITTLLILITCAHRPVSTTISPYPELLELVDEFYREAEKRGVVLPYPVNLITYSPLIVPYSPSFHGICDPWADVVLINSRHEGTPTDWKKYVIFHEMFHCAGDLPHRVGGLMHSTADYQVFSEEEWKKMLDEEFERVRQRKDSLRIDLLRPYDISPLTSDP